MIFSLKFQIYYLLKLYPDTVTTGVIRDSTLIQLQQVYPRFYPDTVTWRACSVCSRFIGLHRYFYITRKYLWKKMNCEFHFWSSISKCCQYCKQRVISMYYRVRLTHFFINRITHVHKVKMDFYLVMHSAIKTQTIWQIAILYI
jgi:hypothetical protein